jgi:phenylalanyl-tRNA synthetase alpha chain
MDLEQVLLDKVAEGGEVKDTWDLALELGLEHQVVVGALKSLLVESYLQDEPLSQSFWTLTAEGKDIVENG